jgi:hypothetical protein
MVSTIKSGKTKTKRNTLMSNYLSTYYQQFIAKSRYARWLEDQGRRKDWPETVSRYIENIVADKVDVKTKYEIEGTSKLGGSTQYAWFDDCG